MTIEQGDYTAIIKTGHQLEVELSSASNGGDGFSIYGDEDLDDLDVLIARIVKLRDSGGIR